jgi:hypothetical protein
VCPLQLSAFHKSYWHDVKGEFTAAVDLQDKDLAENLNQWQQRFRTTFLRIIADRKQRNEYFEKKFEAEYGSRFVARMKDLAQRFVDAIDGALPPCAIDKVGDLVLCGSFVQHFICEFLFVICCKRFIRNHVTCSLFI